MTKLRLSSRTELIGPSPTLAVTAKAKRMRSKGLDVISFAAGEPDFNTPEPIRAAAVEALAAGQTKYTPSSGTPELKAAICEKLERENGLRYGPDQVIASCGAKHSVFNALMVLLDPGDEVLLLAPYWMTYAAQVKLAGGVPVVVPTYERDRWAPDEAALREAISERSRVVIVNSPVNPTGAAYDQATLERIAQLALRHGLWIISDEIYERLVYEGPHRSILHVDPEVAEQCLYVSGCSKTYAMTGWRIGYAAGPEPVIRAMSELQDQVTSNPTSFAQAGAVTALSMKDHEVEAMRLKFRARRDLMIEEIRKIEGMSPPLPAGAFYVFLDVRPYLGERFPSDEDLALYLLEEALVATVPGSAFEGPGYLRLTYAASEEDIVRGIGRIGSALEALS